MELFSLQLILLLCNLLICGVSSLDTQNNVNDLDPNIDPTLLKMNDDEIEATYGELNMGMDLFEGDIKLTESQRKFVESSRSVGNIQTRALISDPSKLWNGGKVPYEIDSSLSEESVDYVNEAIDEWQSRTCVTFHEKTDSDEDYIQFVYEQGCSSYVGRIGGHQTISVGNEDQSIVCKKGNIIHEIAHALGFFHEHSRPDRDDYVDVLWNNVVSGYEKNFYKETTETVNSRGIGYDYGSVMHYGEFFFTKQRGSRTLVPKTSGVSIGQRIGLSDLDVQQARILYQCDESRDQPSKNNRTSLRGKSEKELWTRPLREHEVKVLRKSKVQSHKHKNQEDKHKKYETKARPIKKKDSSSKDTKKKTVNSAPAVAPETPNQLATDRATLAQEKEDAVQQQDNEDIENLGKDYFEGDMILTPKQQAYLDNIKTNGAPTQEGTKRGLIKDTTYLWPKAKVYFDFDKGVDRIGRRRARAAMRHWQKHTCLKFKRVRNDPDNLGFIKFVFEGGCASRVGRGGNKMQKLTIGSPSLRCKVGNIIHELGHAVGFFHEHSRPDRNKYVRVLKKNILPGYERNFFRFGRKWIDSRDVPYDYGSIMHYNRAFFSRFPVMLDTLLPLRAVEIGQRKALSRFDILQANLLYKCDGRKRLTDEEIEELKEEVENEMEDQSYEAFCADVYDQNSCQEIKSRGYCQKFPRSMRTTCGITCNLCGMNRPQQTRGEVPHVTRKRLVDILKSSPLKEEGASNRMFAAKP
ncbi:Nematocyst expressed protein 6 [Acropora cervicornis]|uniref:Metalloendopeptidase n=1 Tax=Acropora cervicornis TaxID=6130 RepID=A0AAD9R3Q7_ACRCE|nr:Nematocyst expressed protein 6 [Acropora cervicornis]